MKNVLNGFQHYLIKILNVHIQTIKSLKISQIFRTEVGNDENIYLYEANV